MGIAEILGLALQAIPQAIQLIEGIKQIANDPATPPETAAQLRALFESDRITPLEDLK